MEGKNRNILVVLIAIVIVAAVFSSFGMSLFPQGTAQIVLPTDSPQTDPGVQPEGSDQSYLFHVDITPQTVQTVIADTLVRPESYYRTVTVEDFWGAEGHGTTTAQVWVDGGWTMVRAQLPGGSVRTSIVGDGQFWLWYGGSGQVLSGPADGQSADLEGQRIPTYERVLELDQEQIARAGYEEKGGLSCIYVQTGQDELGMTSTYWVSVETGLLVAAETAEGEQVVYRMSAYAVERPVPETAVFALPDGTVLHTPGQAAQPDSGQAADSGAD